MTQPVNTPSPMQRLRLEQARSGRLVSRITGVIVNPIYGAMWLGDELQRGNYKTYESLESRQWIQWEFVSKGYNGEGSPFWIYRAVITPAGLAVLNN